jgi:hypothetical protein
MTSEQFIKEQREMSNEDLIEQCKNQIRQLAKTGGRSHTMSVPPKITDTDMILSETVRRFEKLLNMISF